MGLDMYLTRKYYVKNWDHHRPEYRYLITILRGGKPSSIDTGKLFYVETEEIYWRKSNAIHKWFVDHVQGGNDDCGTYYVEEKQLAELLETVEKVLASTKLRKGKIVNGYQYTKGKGMKPIVEDGKIMIKTDEAKRLLPTQEGCFFGGYDYDEYYYQDLEYTAKELHRLLDNKQKEGEYGDYYYHSSW